MSKGSEFFKEFVAFRSQGKLVELIDNFYHQDSELMTFPEFDTHIEQFFPDKSAEILNNINTFKEKFTRSSDKYFYKGRDDIKGYYLPKPNVMGSIQKFEINFIRFTDDLIIFKATSHTEHTYVKTEEVLFISEGKLLKHLIFTLPTIEEVDWVNKKTGQSIELQPTKGMVFIGKMSLEQATKPIDEFLEKYYHKDAQIQTVELEYVGLEAIKKHLKEKQSKVLNFSLDYYTESEDVYMYKSTVETETDVIKVADALYLKDNKIFRQFSHSLPQEKMKTWISEV